MYVAIVAYSAQSRPTASYCRRECVIRAVDYNIFTDIIIHPVV